MAEMYKLGLGQFEERRDTGRWLGTGGRTGTPSWLQALGIGEAGVEVCACLTSVTAQLLSCPLKVLRGLRDRESTRPWALTVSTLCFSRSPVVFLSHGESS